MLYVLIGALMIVAGVVLLAWAALARGRMSDPGPNPNDTGRPTLEPRHRGMGFLFGRENLPGLLLIVIGAILLFAPLF